ncbi:MAG: hypothetical protein M1331_01740 [Candidatus Marsarchaeota archaeon]|nr:hypothetical protein [Candidatus Marsarchaeota archaeon]MCL5106101.1 hypothetical protein [Candidatus Marsarchaeota archaeon]
MREKFNGIGVFLNMDFNKFMLLVDDKNQTGVYILLPIETYFGIIQIKT